MATLLSRAPTTLRPVGETGVFAVGYLQGGRENAKHFVVTAGGYMVFPPAQRHTKAGALALAERCDRLVRRWRRSRTP